MDEAVEEQLMIVATLLLTGIPFVYICNLDREYDVNNSNLLSLLRCLCCRGILMCIADECSSGACAARPRVPVDIKKFLHESNPKQGGFGTPSSGSLTELFLLLGDIGLELFRPSPSRASYRVVPRVVPLTSFC